ncbi:hypothetical protein RintRC_6380 [Richelia intracellularis]|nr:hypothetical protein RintRC_6380 [Richelia intracellularis]
MDDCGHSCTAGSTASIVKPNTKNRDTTFKLKFPFDEKPNL